VSKRLERENARAEIDEFLGYLLPNMLELVRRRAIQQDFDAAADYLRALATRCDEMKEHAAKLNGEAP
jgi:hypothetical protein